MQKNELRPLLLTVYKNYLKIILACVAQWIELQPVNQRVTGLIPSQGTCLGCRPGPWLGGEGEATTH